MVVKWLARPQNLMIKVRIPLKVYSVNFVFEMNKNKVSNPRPLSRVLIARYSSSLQQWSRRFLIYRFGREVITALRVRQKCEKFRKGITATTTTSTTATTTVTMTTTTTTATLTYFVHL